VLRRLACLSLLPAVLGAQSPLPVAAFAEGAVEVGGQRYGYRWLEPLPEHRAVPRPLLVFLHGAGERGVDNERQLRWLPEVLAAPAARSQLPCFLLAEERWSEVTWSDAGSTPLPAQPSRALMAVQQALDEVSTRPGIDPGRIYATGLSMGGFGAIELAMRAPDRFAGLLAVCGGGDPALMARLVGMPIQLWHGAADRVVPPSRSRVLVEAMAAIGAPIEYHELPDVGHDVWRQAYGAGGGLPWLLAQDQRQQRRGSFALPAVVPLVDDVQLSGSWFVLPRGARCFAAGAARGPAALFLEAIETPQQLRPGLVPEGETAAGDVEFGLDPALPELFTITFERTARIVARDVAGLRRAAAVAAQALHTGPRRQTPAGRLRQRNALVGGVVELPGSTAWTPRQIVSTLRECWWFGATTLALAAPLPAWSDDDAARVAAEAERYGVTLQTGAAAAVAAAAAAAWSPVAADAGAWLAAPPPPTAPAPFRVAPPAGVPADVLATLRWQLPAAAERASRGGVLHAASFWSRLGMLRR
jgi:predicted esterase